MSRDLLRHRGLRARPERLSEVHGSAIWLPLREVLPDSAFSRTLRAR